MGSVPGLVHSTQSELARSLARRGIETFARVAVRDGASDIVIQLPSQRLALIRHAAHINPGDHSDLETMLSEGTFVWAALVYDHREGPETVGLVETFHISELDRLVSRLSELREAFSEAR